MAVTILHIMFTAQTFFSLKVEANLGYSFNHDKMIDHARKIRLSGRTQHRTGHSVIEILNWVVRANCSETSRTTNKTKI